MKNRIWLITGISSGLGKALAEAVIESGDFVIGTFRNKEQAAAFNQKYRQKAEGILLELSDQASIETCVQKIKEKYNRLDVLVNNAGLGFAGAVEEASEHELRHIMEVNFFGPWRLCKELLPLFRKQKSGYIVQVSSHAGVKAFPGFGIYSASKFALEGLSEAMAQELNPLGVRVLIVEPGPFRTNFAGGSLQKAALEIDDYQDTAGSFRKKLSSVHGKQEGSPEKAAQAILDVVNAQDPTLRLPLGKIPLVTIKMKADGLLADLKANTEIAQSVVFE